MLRVNAALTKYELKLGRSLREPVTWLLRLSSGEVLSNFLDSSLRTPKLEEFLGLQVGNLAAALESKATGRRRSFSTADSTIKLWKKIAESIRTIQGPLYTQTSSELGSS